ncbi:uncharacterized protein LOC113302635 [Papaver somniferum]|uniref:uncharacterized protein LOC113302635 n=1 Tax=Papaver somniferum TaxID=3469 RepID=UPI000E70355D|nr:uncharacterized protein LOC113302635 [Papaver somniferum]
MHLSTNHPGFFKVIQYSWVEDCTRNPAFCFLSKLKRLKIILKLWNWEVFGDLRIKVKTTEEEALGAYLESDADPANIELLNKLVTIRRKNELASQQYNELMREKSRVKWVKEGGANTFFHTTMRIMKAYNNISELENTEVFEEELFDDIPKVLNDEDNIFFDAIPSQDEIKSAVFGIDANSALGPDGFPDSFYRFAWDVVGNELVEAIHYCWNNRFIPKRFNSNFLFVLPKIQGAKKSEHFRPIGLENFNFKIIIRIITAIISTVIGRMVSSQQGAFIKGRNIHEKIMLVSSE